MGSEIFSITGQVGSPVFAGWIMRHGSKLGLTIAILDHHANRVTMTVSGPDDLRDAMALGCSLGPWDVLVDDVEREVC